MRKIKVKVNKVNKVNKIAQTDKPEQLSEFTQQYRDDYNKESQPKGASPNNPSGISFIPTKVTVSQHIKMSIRLPRGIVTSLTIKKNIIALWFLYRTPKENDPEQIIDLIEEGKDIKEDTIMSMINSFVYDCLEDWDFDTGKGLSDFVTELMIQDALEDEESEDYSLYTALMSLMGKEG